MKLESDVVEKLSAVDPRKLIQQLRSDDRPHFDNYWKFRNELKATTHLVVGGVALTLAVFLSSTIEQHELMSAQAGAKGFEEKDATRHSFAQKQRALGFILFAWWVSLAGFLLALGIDVPNVVSEVSKADLAAHGNLVNEFIRSDWITKIDVGTSLVLPAVSSLAISFAVWLRFPDHRPILRGKR